MIILEALVAMFFLTPTCFAFYIMFESVFGDN